VDEIALNPATFRNRTDREICSTLVHEMVHHGQGRPEPPPDRDELEQSIWRAVVDALPAHWVDRAGEIVLRRLVAQAAVAQRREARLRELRAVGRDIGEDADAVVAQHGVGAKLVAFLLGTLRATPKARERSRDAEPAVNRAAKFRPWEGDAS
jgi:hypothetical protein